MKKQYTCPIAEVFETQTTQMIAGSLTGKSGTETILPSGGTISKGEADSKASAFDVDFDDDIEDDEGNQW